MENSFIIKFRINNDFKSGKLLKKRVNFVKMTKIEILTYNQKVAQKSKKIIKNFLKNRKNYTFLYLFVVFVCVTFTRPY